jgi:hypothetical protein
MPFLATFGAAGAKRYGFTSGKGRLGTLANPAVNGKAIYAADPTSTTGTYWLISPGGVVYQAYIKMDYGGGWVNLNLGALGPYTTPLTSGNGTGGGNHLSGGSSTFAAALGASYINNSQAVTFQCPGYDYRSYVTANATMVSELGATQIRFKASATSLSGVTCGYINSGMSSYTLISGTNNMISVCNNPPNSYSEVNPGSFTVEAYGGFVTSTTRVYESWTACGGSFSSALTEVYIR